MEESGQNEGMNESVPSLSVSIGETPAAQGFCLPAEWEPHAATWLTWPRRDGISFPEGYERIPTLWARMAVELAAGEDVHINLFDDAVQAEACAALASIHAEDLVNSHIHFHRFPAYEPWCRDHGPIFLKRDGKDGESELAVVDWRYNAWGGKYPPFDLDDAIPQHVAAHLGLSCFAPDWVLEGGAIDGNGQGTLLTTEACLLHPNRNGKVSKPEVEQWLGDYLGVKKMLWLGEGIEGDDTDGHVDDITRFVSPTTVLTCIEPDPADPNHEPLSENRRRLETMTTARGESLRIIDLPMPGRIERNGQRLPASYANFYIGNACVLLPVYGHANDAVAIEVLRDAFASRRVVPVDCTELIWGLGAFHCVTQQQPAVEGRR